MKMVCIKKGQWIYSISGKPVMLRCPNFGEIVTVERIVTRENGEKVFQLVEYPELNEYGTKPQRRTFSPHRFRPIIKDEPKASTEKFDFRTKLKENA